jgi:hypothetical protein
MDEHRHLGSRIRICNRLRRVVQKASPVNSIRSTLPVSVLVTSTSIGPFLNRSTTALNSVLIFEMQLNRLYPARSRRSRRWKSKCFLTSNFINSDLLCYYFQHTPVIAPIGRYEPSEWLRDPNLNLPLTNGYRQLPFSLQTHRSPHSLPSARSSAPSSNLDEATTPC